MKDLIEINNKNILDTTIDPKPIDTINYDNTDHIAHEILNANQTGFINNLIDSNLALRPKLLINDYNNGCKVLSDIVSELIKCEEFMISVAFVTSSGITPLLETLKTLQAKGIQGKIITTDYLNFSEPKALKKLLDFSNISIRMYCKENFHTKGYIFKHRNHYKLIVGSSNLTQTALTKNKEWNIKVSSLEEGSLTNEVLSEFKTMWSEADELTLDLLKTYETLYLKQRESLRKSSVPRISQYTLKPNKMQLSAIQALEEDLLCPFHYFGISDITIDGDTLSENVEFKYLVSDQRVSHILDKINFYGYSGDKVKGLVFCSNKKEAGELSIKFNEYGFRTLALTGENTQEERNAAISRLEQDENEDCLDYIFTVDIFNEGVDIPTVNQIVMLRATKSAIIFIQQLGRGLRKNNLKEFVVIIDFVGNYNKNFLIPIALSGDRTYNKDTIRKYVMEGNRIIPGCSTINFDEISKKHIFESIDKANFNDVKLIKENYTNLKQKLGRIPKLIDFDLHDSIDPLRIFDNKSLGSYHKFLVKYEKEYNIEFNSVQESFLEFISKKLASGKRIHELVLIKCALNNRLSLISNLRYILNEQYNINFKDSTVTSVINVLTNEFASGTGKETYKDCIFLEKYDSDYKISDVLLENLKNQDFKDSIIELIEFGIDRYNKYYSLGYKDTNFKLYQKYTYEDVCRILEWERNEVATNIGGYKFNKETKTYPVFINYNKSEEISAIIRYEDRFITPSLLIGISKQPRKVDSPDIIQMYNAEKDGVTMSLFVRKNKDDKSSKEFYYLGKIKAVGMPHPITIKNTDKSAVEINYELETPIREDLYDFFIS